MSAQIEIISPKFAGDTAFAVTLQPMLPTAGEEWERVSNRRHALAPDPELEFRGVPDSALHE